jgi:diketogulonate reductase-like aldo/keto reductase
MVPAVNQIEVNPFNMRTELAAFCEKNSIVIEAYALLAKASRMKHPMIVVLSKKYSCTLVRLMIRWSLHHGYVPLPESITKERIVESSRVERLNIDEDDMKEMDQLD